MRFILSSLLVLLLASSAAAQGTWPYQMEAVDSPNDTECLCYDLTTTKFEWLAGGGGGGGGHTIQEESSSLTQRDTLRFIGTAMTCVDATTRTDCTIAITLGTDTSGNYAVGDAEGGNATGLACADCVALGSETTGNYAGSGSEGGAATTAAALSTNPTACSGGDFVTDIAADGTLTCGTPSGSGDVTDVFDCASGNCADIVVGVTDSLDFSAIDANAAGEGLILPQTATCAGTGQASGTVCYQTSGDAICVYDGSAWDCQTLGVSTEVNDLEAQDPPTIQSTEVYIGTGAGTGAFAALTGDVTMTNAGVTAIGADTVALGTDTTGGYAASSSEGGAATTATALAANGANCSAASFPLGVDASGAVESCSTSISGNAATVTVADASGDTTAWPLMGTSITGSLAPASDAELTYNATTNNLATTTFTGALSGNATTATSATTATNATNVATTNADNVDTSMYPLVASTVGTSSGQAAQTDVGLSWNSSTNALTATTFIGALTGNSSTATALAANGANCSSGTYPLGVDASGAVETCTTDDDVPEAADFDAFTAGDFLTYSTSADSLAWDGVYLYNDGTAIGKRVKLNFSSDFATTDELITNGDGTCIGGSVEGTTCSSNTDCTGSGVCTDSKGTLISLNSTVYREGDTIAATDMPLSGVVDWGALTSLEVPNSAGAAPTVSGQVAVDTTTASFEWGAGGANYAIYSGTYTPTITNVANAGGSPAGAVSQYMRVGNVVTVSGAAVVDPTTTNTRTQIGVSLPIASNFAAATNGTGIGFWAGTPAAEDQVALLYSDATNDRMELYFTPVNVASDTIYFTFTYRVI